MYYSLRILCFILITTLWYVGLPLFSVPVILWCSYRYIPYELLFLGALVDIEFMTQWSVPLYTTGAILWIAVLQFIKPMLSVSTPKL